MAIDNNNGIDGLGGTDPYGNDPSSNVPGTDPSMTSPLDELMEAIKKLLKEMESGKPADHSEEIAMVLAKMNSISGGVVKADAETMTVMNKYDGASANMQTAISDQKQGDTSVPLINPYTGQPELNSDGTQKTGTPEEAISRDAQFLKNDGNQPYQLDENGHIMYKADGKTPIANRAYQFFHANNGANMSLYNSMSGNVDSVMKGIDPSYNPSGTPDPNYPSGSGGASYELPAGSVYNNLWKPINDPGYGPDHTANKPDSTNLQAVQSAHASLVQSLSSNSSAIQSLSQQDSNNYQQVSSILTKFDQAWLSVMKACNNGIKAA